VTAALTIPGFVVVPVVVGLVAGLVCTRLAERRRLRGTIIAATALALTPLLPAVVGTGPIRVGVWDMATLAALALVGLRVARSIAGPGLGRRLLCGPGLHRALARRARARGTAVPGPVPSQPAAVGG
jgi:hypothetical protein